MPFVYSSDALGNLERAIAKDRLLPYLQAAQGDTCKAIWNYERNTLLSQSLYGIIQPLEIAFRNSIHKVLSTDTARTNWYDYVRLRYAETETVKEAKKNLFRWNKTVTPGRLVSELTFGFWVKLINRDYEKLLWVPHLYKAVPHLRKPDRKYVYGRFDDIRQLRNRIAHHEPIISRNLEQDYSNILGALDWICPVTASWIRATNSFQRDFCR